MLLCLDSLLYGGLVASRRSADTVDQLLKRAGCLKKWCRQLNGPVFAQASIMRISDNYDPTEEKPYWAHYGREIFAWSYLLHQLTRGQKIASGSLARIEDQVPAEILSDYLQGRRRNFHVNRALLNTYLKSEALNLLIFSLDDSGAFGLNILEKERLLQLAGQLHLSHKALCYPGADEVVLTMLSRWLIQLAGVSPCAQVIYSSPETASCPSRYEGQSISETVASQLAASAITQTDRCSTAADFTVLIHGRPGYQGDHIYLPGQDDLRSLDTTSSVEQTLAALTDGQQPVVLCDVAYANGADPALIEALLKRPELLARLWSYAGWNTTGNTVGSALATGVARWFAGRRTAAPTSEHTDLAQNLKTCLFVRLADDWAYQAVVRKTLSGPASSAQLSSSMDPYLNQLAAALDLSVPAVNLRHPWQRTFEIEVAL